MFSNIDRSIQHIYNNLIKKSAIGRLMTAAIANKSEVRKPFMVNFKDDTLHTVSRATVRALSDKLGFNETQTVLYALARLRDEVALDEASDKQTSFKPLTKRQHAVLAHTEPKTRGRIIGSLLP
jgi:predicted nucleic acid-binding protein